VKAARERRKSDWYALPLWRDDSNSMSIRTQGQLEIPSSSWWEITRARRQYNQKHWEICFWWEGVGWVNSSWEP